jgi:hypothetical protein
MSAFEIFLLDIKWLPIVILQAQDDSYGQVDGSRFEPCVFENQEYAHMQKFKQNKCQEDSYEKFFRVSFRIHSMSIDVFCRLSLWAAIR